MVECAAPRLRSCCSHIRMHVSTAALILITSVWAGAQSAGVPETASFASDNGGYRALVDSYRRYGPDEVAAVLAMSREAATEAVDKAVSTSSTWRWDELRAAAMLHSQACLAALNKADRAACDFHLTQAQRLLQTVTVHQQHEDFVWRWYTVMPRVLDDMEEKVLAQRLDAHVRTAWRLDTSRAEYMRGLQYELKGAREGLRPSMVGSMVAASVSQARFLAAAADAFAKALKQRPDLSAAALHLGRVRMLQEQWGEAATLFHSALAGVDPSVNYLATLFLGSLVDRDGHVDEAEKLYRDAIRLMPYGQSASLVLAELLSRTGREAAARQVLAERVLHLDAELLDPFWAYNTAPDEAITTRFDLLRMEVWK